jgi:diaminopimelate decarboxylase
VLHALANGWQPAEITHTGTNVSERDLDVLLAHPIRLNLDAVSQVERVGRRAPGRTIGIRVNPGAGAGYTAHLAYAGERPTKFGVTEERLDDAIDAARRHGLEVDTLHFHAGSGWLGNQLDGFAAALERATSPRASRSRRSTSVAGWVASPASTRSRWTSTPTPPSWRATSGRMA